MPRAKFLLRSDHPHIVGSFGSESDLSKSPLKELSESCELLEIRLDILRAAGIFGSARPWSRVAELPLLFTARRQEEGGAMSLDDEARMAMLEGVLDQAALLDIEVESIRGMAGLIGLAEQAGVPWVGSFHDFEKLPETSVLTEAAQRAKDAGAAVFKVAAKLSGTADLARLAEFQLADHGLPVATMGMGALAPVSRLLCAQYGSVLNYGYVGDSPTAPGQWDFQLLSTAVRRLAPVR